MHSGDNALRVKAWKAAFFGGAASDRIAQHNQLPGPHLGVAQHIGKGALGQAVFIAQRPAKIGIPHLFEDVGGVVPVYAVGNGVEHV